MTDSRPAGRGLLDGRHIVVTGAASGIGRMVAKLFHAEGARLALVDRNAGGLEEAAAEFEAHPFELDLLNAEAIPRTVDQAAEAMGTIDGVVNCAGLGSGLPIGDVDPETLAKVIGINLTAPYLLCRAALPYLRESTVGTIVNVASGAGLLPNSPNQTAYAAAKGGLVMFTKALAAEIAPKVRANVICPGVTNTPMAAPLLAGYDDPSMAPWVSQYALKRVAEPMEIAKAILFMTSAESSYVTGVALAVDGGRTFH